jgi:hypothetical protein
LRLCLCQTLHKRFVKRTWSVELEGKRVLASQIRVWTGTIHDNFVRSALAQGRSCCGPGQRGAFQSVYHFAGERLGLGRVSDLALPASRATMSGRTLQRCLVK